MKICLCSDKYKKAHSSTHTARCMRFRVSLGLETTDSLKPKKSEKKIIYTAWYCPNKHLGHYVIYKATQEMVDDHLKECKLSKKSKKVKKVRKPIKKVSSIGKLKKQLETIIKTKAKERDGYVCQRCGKKVEGSDAHGSHIIPVSASQLLRFDIENIKCLCYHCHLNWWHKNPLEAGRWFESTFPERFEYLQKRKLEMKKWTREELNALLEKYKCKST